MNRTLLQHGLIFIISLLLLSSALFAQPVGATMANPINAGNFPGNPYSDLKNNSPSNHYGNDFGQSSEDIFYKINVTSSGSLKLSHCNSPIDTYMYLLDDKGNIIASNDDSGQCSNYFASYINVHVYSGVYYIVSEGWSSTYGNIYTNISFDPDGSRLDNALSAGKISSGIVFSDIKNNISSNHYGNEMGQSSDDIYHKFTLDAPLEVTMSHCGSSFDTYIHLLDANGSLLASNDDWGPECQTMQASLKVQLNAGTYYVVSEGYSSNSGNISLEIKGAGESQLPNCDTEDMDSLTFASQPWVRNNNYLESFLDSIGYDTDGGSGKIPTTSGLQYGIKYYIPIKLHYTGSTIPTDAKVRTMMQQLNKVYAENGTRIQFYLACQPHRIDDVDYQILDRQERRHLARKYEEPFFLNVFICGALENNKKGAGVLEFSSDISFNPFRSVFVGSGATDDPLFNLLAHEIGHYLDLLHTHHYDKSISIFMREAVDYNRTMNGVSFSEFTGDGLRDTPADPNLDPTTSVNCTYVTPGLQDLWGDFYLNPPAGSSPPSAVNVMSYNHPETCTTQFTRLQNAVMLHYLDRKSSYKSIWNQPVYIVDTYEPDNSYDAASPIVPGETQAHNFHYQPKLLPANLTSCDVDWVRYVPTSTGTIAFTTSSAGGTNANTKISVYEVLTPPPGGLLQLPFAPVASNDDISGTNHFSQVAYNCRAGYTYLIKIENMEPTVNGRYSFTLGCDLSYLAITGPEYFCSNATYSVDPATLPAGSTVTWWNSGNLTENNGNTGTAYTVTNTGAGAFVTFTATVAAPCSGPYTISKTVPVNNPSLPYGQNMIYSWDTPSQPGTYSFSIPLYPGATYYTWDVSGPQGTPYMVQDGSNDCTVMMDYAGWYSLVVKVTTPCGELWLDNQQLDVYVPDGYGYYAYSYAPNPASNELSVWYNEKENKASKKLKKDFEIKLLDSRGKILRSKKNISVDNKIIIDVSEILEGTYFLHIYDGKNVVKKQILIKH